MNRFLIFLLLLVLTFGLNAQVKILFNATKAESAGNADWVIDADLHNIGYTNGPPVVGQGSESNPQRLPTPAQSTVTSTTTETYWKGGISAWGIDLVKKGYVVETLPYNGAITYGNSSNVQDLSNYKVFIDCEPNILYTAAEKTAIMQFVQNGGGLFMVSDHTSSDRNNDGWDSPEIWNDLMTNNGIQSNPFGISFDLASFSQTTTNIPNLPADPILHGIMGNVTSVMWSSGTSITVNTTANSSVKGIIYKTGSAFGSSNILFAYSTYGNGKIVAIGDSSPCDDGTGDSGDALYNGWTGDAGGNHERLMINATIWLATSNQVLPTVTTLAATTVTSAAATLYGSVNPNGAATSYHFDWGTTTSYGNSTATVSAGSGTSTVNVSANISGLTPGLTYHFRLSGVNSAGTSNGSDMTFIPGGVTLTTTAVSAIISTGATSGGNITSDGGATITARGVCWSNTINPVVTGYHTTDGSGTGSFTSTISGLTANTSYHVRAYATNTSGTYYGNDILFTTACGSFTLPFTESFTATTLPNCWSQIDNQGSGDLWAFGIISGVTPLPVLTGNYAFLNSDGYGNGHSQNVDLVTPTLNLTGYSSVNLAFKHYFSAYTGSSGTLSYSINNGTSWTSIASFTTSSATNPAVFSQVVNAAAGQSLVKFKWNYTGTWGYYWAVDDINITGVQAVPPIVTTTAASSITLTSAISGGNVTSGGTSQVTARGICWSTSANPTIFGNHTTDGSGTGIFSSSLTGLISGATYHIRAYATNSTGTSYGNDLMFTTLCNTISSFPWNEGFENGGLIPNCWTQEQVNSSSLDWMFVAGNGASNPAAAHGGAYNACLKDISTAANITRLITPSMNLSGLVNTSLTFWHTQAVLSTNQDQLLVYYKTSAAGSWILLNSYTANVAAWTQRTINLPDGSNDYYVAFEGNAKYGYGVCLDDVSITGETPVLSVTPANRAVDGTAGSTTFGVSSNTSWTVVSNQTWCTVTPSGSGDGTITATYAQNTSIPARVADITVSVAGLTPVVVTVTQAGIPCVDPMAFAGNDTTILENENLQLNGFASNFSDILWTSSGDGIFDNPGLMNPVYNPGAQDIANSTVEISLTAYPNLPCTLPASDILTLTILRQQIIEFPMGWSGFSSYVVPLNPAFEVFMSPVADNLVVAKTITQVYWPMFGINTIGNFQVLQGYIVKMNAPASLPVTGFKSIDKTINLVAGWNILPVVSENEVGYQELLYQLGGNLVIVKEIAGGLILWPEAGVYSLATLVPGKAYMIKVSVDCSFTFPD